MGASDYMVGNAPGGVSYAPPNYAAQLQQGIGNLYGDYFQGAQQRRTLELQKPILDANGQPITDPGALLPEILRRGGTEAAQDYVKAMLPLMIGQQANMASENMLNPGARSPAPTAAAGPAQLGVQPQVAGGGSAASAMPNKTPGPPVAGEGQDSIRTLAGELFGADRDVLPFINRTAKELRINPDSPVNPSQASAVRARLRQLAQGEGGTVGPAETNTRAQATSAADEATPSSASPGAPFAPHSGASGSPAPAPTAAPETAVPGGQSTPTARQAVPAQQPPAPVRQPVRPPPAQGGTTDPTLGGLVPKGWTAESRIAALVRAASLPGLPEARKQGYLSQVKAIQDVLAKNAELTPEQKNAQSSGMTSTAEYEKIKKQNEDDVTRYGKMLSGIQGSAGAANRQLEHIQLAEGIYQNPNFYSGAGEGLNLWYKKVVAALNPNSTEALPQEAFRKTMAAAVLNQVEQLKDDTAAVGGGGRIFQSQIELMEKAANNPDNSIAANRALTEINKRVALRAKEIAGMANSYKGGHLDAQFAQKVDDYFTQHPMFTAKEMADIRTIAPPVAPTSVKTPADLKAWEGKFGLKSGDPFKTPKSEIKYVP
jgi:hypothetical protein